MSIRVIPVAFLVALIFIVAPAAHGAGSATDTERDILVTFDNTGTKSSGARPGASYSQRKRYSISRTVRRDAAAIAEQFDLLEVDHWPIRSLSIYCFVYRVPVGVDRQAVIAQLSGDSRIDSVQTLQTFETGLSTDDEYDDTYAKLQYGLDILNIQAAHRASTGRGVRIAIVDSSVDRTHEDLQGRIERMQSFSGSGVDVDDEHGTAVASVIGASSNNATGIVGVAPDARIDVFVSCWDGGAGQPAVCDSFSLSKALDSMLENPPDILNLSLQGPRDQLLERLLLKAAEAGVVMVAAGSRAEQAETGFPSSLSDVMGVASSLPSSEAEGRSGLLYAPGERILVALPVDQYDFRSGSSLAAAHVSGVVALLIAVDSELGPAAIHEILAQSQYVGANGAVSIDACKAINLASQQETCLAR